MNLWYLNRLIVLEHEGSRGVNILTSFVPMFYMELSLTNGIIFYKMIRISRSLLSFKQTGQNLLRSRSSGALRVEVWICTTMALQNLQQYGCQTGNKLKEKSRDLNGTLVEIKMKQCSVADTKTVRSLEL